MKENIFVLLLLLLTSLPLASAGLPDGTIPFDCPDVPNPKFQFHFTRELIALATTTAPFNTVENIYIHIYDDDGTLFDALVTYYSEQLTAANWHNSQADSNGRLYVLKGTANTIKGLFAVSQSNAEVYLLNIVGAIPIQQTRSLLVNLSELGINIPVLVSIGKLSLPESTEITERMLLPTLFRIAGNSEVVGGTTGTISVSTTGFFKFTATSAYQENHQGHWTYRGYPIERIRIHADERDQIATISDGLKSGVKDITELLDERLSVSKAADTPRFIVQTAERSITIHAGDPLGKTQPTMLTKTFRTREREPIHEIVIRGNRYTEAHEIRTALEKGPDEIEKAVEALPLTVPSFQKADLLIEEQDSRRTAIITAIETRPASRSYLDWGPRIGFNRVTGWELGARIESGFRAPQTTPSSLFADNDNSKIFGQIGYGFGDKRPYYQVGGRVVWEEPYSWHLGLTAQYYRATGIIAPDLFSHYNDTATTILRIFGVPDHQNYYLRNGVEVELQWKAVLFKHPSIQILPNHSFKLILLAESHESLEKNTDWHLFNWSSKSEARGNPLITQGQMRSATFRYDFDTRNNYLGSHHTFFVEHSNPAFGSDFNWTRFQAHLRYAYPIRDHQIRVRGVVGSATAALPIQRQFVMGGIGTLNGYPLYTFAGDAGFLFNTEFIYKLFSFGNQSLSAAFIFDGGQVWNFSEDTQRFDPKGSVGIGLQFETDVDIFRFNVAKAFDAEQGFQYNFMFFYSF